MKSARVVALAAVLTLLASCGAAGGARFTAAPSDEAFQAGRLSFAPNVRIGWPRGDDWEPYLTADGTGHLYAVITHLSARHLAVQRSDDGGTTWTRPVEIDPAPTNTGQFDPWMAVDPSDGSVLVTYMQNDPAVSIRMVRSSDRGVTWSKPIAVSGRLHGLDKDAMALRGNTIAVCFDDFFRLYAAISTDRGRTWRQHRIAAFGAAPLQFLCSGAGIDSRGTIFFSWDSSRRRSTSANPAAEVWIERSADLGRTWKKTHVGYGGAAYPCAHCGAGAFFGSQMSLAVDVSDTVYVLWNATPTIADRIAQRIYFAKSVDGGASFSMRRDISPAPQGVQHAFPTVLTGSAPGDVRIAWEDRQRGLWNVYTRSSPNAGTTWSAPSTISNYVAGYAYLKPGGFDFPYGDYFRLTLDSSGKLHAAWGESPKYTSAGNIWISNQR